MAQSPFEFSSYLAVSHLWSDLLDRLGQEKAQQAISQAFDLQRMYGRLDTIPVLFTETCGLALTSREMLQVQTGLNKFNDNMVLLIDLRGHMLQLFTQS